MKAGNLPRRRAARIPIGRASSVVMAAPVSDIHNELPAAEATSASDPGRDTPATRRCARLTAGTPSADTDTAISMASVGHRSRPSRALAWGRRVAALTGAYLACRWRVRLSGTGGI